MLLLDYCAAPLHFRISFILLHLDRSHNFLHTKTAAFFSWKQAHCCTYLSFIFCETFLLSFYCCAVILWIFYATEWTIYDSLFLLFIPSFSFHRIFFLLNSAMLSLVFCLLTKWNFCMIYHFHGNIWWLALLQKKNYSTIRIGTWTYSWHFSISSLLLNTLFYSSQSATLCYAYLSIMLRSCFLLLLNWNISDLGTFISKSDVEGWKVEGRDESSFEIRWIEAKKMHFEKQTNSSFWINVNEHN